jgi:hypothetical protein
MHPLLQSSTSVLSPSVSPWPGGYGAIFGQASGGGGVENGTKKDPQRAEAFESEEKRL